uniref:Leucine-rich repeat-containing N-terminal plant-type domain-containing protein n=1 Tax=Leersia perrieri TaxID=77586 RepID=A0A0D9VXR6_9ORYZ
MDTASIDYMHRLVAVTGVELLLGWEADSDPSNDNWIWVTCDTYDGNNKIFQIDVNANMNGMLQVFLRNISKFLGLVQLHLDYNHFPSPFPADLSGFNVLSVITVAHNRLTGVIPPLLAQLSCISWVSSSNNLFQGPLLELPSSVKTNFAMAAIRGSAYSSGTSRRKVTGVNLSQHRLTQADRGEPVMPWPQRHH